MVIQWGAGGCFKTGSSARRPRGGRRAANWFHSVPIPRDEARDETCKEGGARERSGRGQQQGGRRKERESGEQHGAGEVKRDPGRDPKDIT